MRSGEVAERRHLTWVLLIAAVAFLLRGYAFWLPELWGDEYGTWWVIAGGDPGEVASRAIRIQGQSPLYYWIVKAFTAVLGEGPVALRLPSLLASSGLVLLAWPLALRLFGDRDLALCAVLTFALQGAFLDCAQDARPYALAILLCAVSMLLYVGLLDRFSRRGAVLYVLATAAVFYTHYLFVTILLAQIAHRLTARAVEERAQLTWARFAILVAAIALLCVPGLWQLASLFGRRQALNWLPVGGVLDTTIAVWSVFETFMNFGVVGLVLLVRLAMGSDPRSFADLPRRRLLLCWLLAPALALAPLPFTHGVNLVYYRYAQAMAPAAALVLAWWIWPPAERTGAVARWLSAPITFAVGMTVLQLLPTLDAYGAFARHEPQGWRAATMALTSKASEGETVFVASGFVECDVAARPGCDPSTLEFVLWPLLANLRGGRTYSVRCLPMTEAAVSAAEDALRGLAASPAQPARLWALGLGTGLRQFVILAEARFGWRITDMETFGNLQLVMLQR